LSYQVYWLQGAVDDLLTIALRDRKAAERVALVVRTFGRDGRGDIKKLQDRDQTWCLRSGAWRVFLTLKEDVAFIKEVSDRRDAYK
jgi:mRNA-degrading endonuclease RelE of RelBE toxin-antitoxin system